MADWRSVAGGLRRGRRLFRVQALSGLAQLTAAAQLLALLLVVGKGRATDAYVTLFSASQISIAVVITGTLQPAVLSRPSYRRWGRWFMSGAVVNAIVIWAVACLLLSLDYPSNDVIITCLLLTVSGTASVAAYVESVRRAANGHPEVLAAATLAANTVATLCLVLVPSHRIAAMCVGLFVGNALTYAFARRDRPKVTTLSDPTVPRGQVVGLLMASGVGSAGPFGLQAVTASFPPGQATILGFLSRIGAGLIGVGVTSFVTVVTDWKRQDVRPLWLAATTLSLFEGGAMLLLAVGHLAQLPAAGSAGLAAVAWVAGAGSQSCAARALSVLGRLTVFSRMAAVSVVLYAGGAWWLLRGPKTALSYFLVLAALAAAANCFFLAALRWRGPLIAFLVPAGTAVLVSGLGVVVGG